MAEKQRVDIEILGQKYPIRSEAGPDYVRQLASFVDRRAREIRGDAAGQDAVRLLALTALDITDELFRLRDERPQGRHRPPRRTAATPRRGGAREVTIRLTRPRGRGYTRGALHCS